MNAWAAWVGADEAARVAALRPFPDLAVARLPDGFWLRGTDLEDRLALELRRIPGLELFEVLAGDRLRPRSSRLAGRRLPAAEWHPVREALPVALPPAIRPGEVRQRVPVRLVRSGEELPAQALLTSVAAWTEYVAGAAQVRLERLHFAAGEQGQVLVVGQPLPPLPGRRFADRDRVLVPCGFRWEPPVDAVVLRQVLAAGPEDYVLLAEDSTQQLLRGEQFVGASRSAGRLTRTAHE